MQEIENLFIDDAVRALQNLPYKKGAYSSRYWGHPYHNLISYPSKLKPSIAHFLVLLFTQEGDTILDPFSGVGTVPFEACCLGRKGIGVDLSPVAFRATQAKTGRFTKSAVTNIMSRLIDYVASNKNEVDMSVVETEIVDFYHEETLKEVVAAREFFLDCEGVADSFVETCLLHILHGNRPYALSRRSHNIMPWPPKGEFTYKPLGQLLQKKIDRMLAHPLPLTYTPGCAYLGDASKIPVENGSIDAILTSPPFFGNRDFLRMNRLRLWFCGWSYACQESMKDVFVEHSSNLSPYVTILDEFVRVLRPGGICVMHLGIVKKFNMAQEISPIAEKSGLDVVGTVCEDTSEMESHGIRDRGATHTHQFLILRR